jgi:hypothetical protein
MARQQELARLAQQVAAASAAADWKALAALNTLMAAALPAMAAQGAWTPAERVALAALRGRHKAAVLAVDTASSELGKHLQQINSHKEGWLAYALDNDLAGTNA